LTERRRFHANLIGGSAGSAERAVDQHFRPGSDIRQDRQDDRGGVP